MSRQSVVLVAALVLMIGGCADGGAPPAPTPAQESDATHGGTTITPYGTVVRGSAQDTDDGSVVYQTEDGRAWKVRPRPDGAYGTPEPVPGTTSTE